MKSRVWDFSQIPWNKVTAESYKFSRLSYEILWHVFNFHRYLKEKMGQTGSVTMVATKRSAVVAPEMNLIHVWGTRQFIVVVPVWVSSPGLNGKSLDRILPLCMKGTCLYSVSLVQGVSRVMVDLSTMTCTISSAALSATWCQCPSVTPHTVMLDSITWLPELYVILIMFSDITSTWTEVLFWWKINNKRANCMCR